MSGELILYQTDDGLTQINLRATDQMVWLTQLEMAELFDTTKQNASLHIQNILKEGELLEDSVVKESLTTAADGKNYRTKLFNLNMILAVGYRVRSPRGVQFRQWATRHLSEYLQKGFLMDVERMKDPDGWDHFDELLEKIREIRASEKRFYQKVRDLFALSIDYAEHEKAAHIFFAEVQNKLLYAVCQHTAAEIVVERADPDSPNMALTNWKGSRVRKQDVTIAKNYLNNDEIDSLNRLVVIFLEQAELRVKERKQLTLDYWRTNVDRLMEFNDRPLLEDKGLVSHDSMKSIAHERYDQFDGNRRIAEAQQADAEDLQELEQLEKELKQKSGAA
ncbi:MAG: virulence RhuM family protein [Pontiella sp.]